MKRWTALLLLAALPSLAGELTGIVTMADGGKAPVKGQAVRLRIYRGENEVSGAEAVTDAGGRYRFRDLAAGGHSYVLAVEYAGVPYFQGPYEFQKGKGSIAAEPIAVYPASPTLEDIFLVQSVFVEVGRSDVLKLHYTVQIQNRGGKAYSPFAEGAEKIVFPLPKGGTGLEFPDFMRNLFELDEKLPGLILKAPVYPTRAGGYTVKFSYLLPYGGRREKLDFSSNAERLSFNLMVDAPKVTVESPLLAHTGDMPVQGKTSRVYATSAPIAAKAPMTVTLGGLPRLGDDYLIGLCGGLCAVAVILAFLGLRRGRARATDEALVDAAVKGLAWLEAGRAAGRVNDSDYAYENQRLREILFELLRRRDAA